MIIERRKIYWEDLEAFCIKHIFYTCGSNDEFNKLHDFVKGCAFIELGDLEAIARDIQEHSGPVILTELLFMLSDEVVITFYEEKEF